MFNLLLTKNSFPGAIFIHEVYEKGAAHKDGRLRPGDQILEVMSENLRNVTHSHALQALRQTPNRVKLIIHREDDEIYETLEVELLKKKDRGLGLSIVGKKSGPGVFISEVVKGKIQIKTDMVISLVFFRKTL